MNTFENEVLCEDDRVLVITRRLYPNDVQRHFIGIVEKISDTAFRARGLAYIRDVSQGKFVRRKGQRTRVFSLDNHVIIFVFPTDVEIREVKYENPEPSRLVVTDGKNLHLDISEFAI